MKRRKVETYDAGYAKESLLKKCAVGVLGAALLGGMLTGCEPTYSGNMSIQDYDGNMVVSPSDEGCGEGGSACSDGQEGYLIDGDMTCEISDTAAD